MSKATAVLKVLAGRAGFDSVLDSLDDGIRGELEREIEAITDPPAKDDGGPAFPCGWHSGIEAPQPGMTLRDWFAGQFMAQMIHAAATQNGEKTPELWSKASYKLADIMLEARR